MAIAIALLGFNDLGCLVTPTFLFRDKFIYNYLHMVQKLTKNLCRMLKKKFKTSVLGTSIPAILQLQGGA